MTIFEKLGLRKKEEAEEKDSPRGDMPPMREMSAPEFDRPEPSFARPLFEPARPSDELRSFDVINAKLDAIRAILDNISARIERLEKIASGEEIPRWR